MMTFDEKKAIANEVEIFLLRKNVWVDGVNWDSELPAIYVTITGDWKHDHLRAKNLMSEAYQFGNNHHLTYWGYEEITDGEEDCGTIMYTYLINY